MSLYDLQKWAPSVEDFADAHEPVNDGVKEVPNAQTIAASVGKGDVGKDTTNSGEAKVIPEKEDTDDNTEKQFDTVSESAEKGGSDSKPAPKAPAAKPAETADSGNTGSETKTDDGSESDTQSEGKAPPFVKKDEAEKKEPLEHDSKEAAEDEKEKTEKVTKALEAYAPHAQRFDIIGYPKADRERLQKSINWLAKRSGLPTGMTISAESIDTVVQAGRGRINYLSDQISKHVASLEDEGGSKAGVWQRFLNWLKKTLTAFFEWHDSFERKTEEALKKFRDMFRSNKPVKVYLPAVVSNLALDGERISFSHFREKSSGFFTPYKKMITAINSIHYESADAAVDQLLDVSGQLHDLYDELTNSIDDMTGSGGQFVMLSKDSVKEGERILEFFNSTLTKDTPTIKTDKINAMFEKAGEDMTDRWLGDFMESNRDCIDTLAGAARKIARVQMKFIDVFGGKETASNEDFVEGPVIDSFDTEPTEHGNAPLPAEAAAAITDLEIGVPDGTFDVDTGLPEVSDAIQTLQEGQVAIEQYLNILRSNKRISKQAAAVLHAGLEAIDQRCGLKVRATGMEGYDTSPKASMEDAAVNEKTLLDRAGEIGAKILKWIKVMIEKAGQAWDKYRMGLDSLKENMVKLKESKFKTEGEIVLRPAPAELFTEGLFTGDWLTPEEERLPGNLATYYTNLTREITRRCRALLSDKNAEDIELVMEALKKEDKAFSKLPGTQQIVSEAGRLHLANADAEQPEEYKVDISDARPGLLLESMIKSIEKLSGLDTIAQLRKASDEVVQGLIKYRKGAGKDLNETDFQKLQQTVVDNSIKLFDVEAYFDIIKYIGKVYNARYKLCAQMVSNA